MKPRIFLSVRNYIHSPLKFILQVKIKRRKCNPSVFGNIGDLAGMLEKLYSATFYGIKWNKIGLARLSDVPMVVTHNFRMCT
jgi:hypothetical protein